MNRRLTPEQDKLARLISQTHCPACGERGYPTVVSNPKLPGVLAVKPLYQCDTPNCPYNHFHRGAWTVDSSN